MHLRYLLKFILFMESIPTENTISLCYAGKPIGQYFDRIYSCVSSLLMALSKSSQSIVKRHVQYN